MGNCISEQMALFLRSVLLGGVLGLLYDLLRPFRRLGGALWGGLLDAAYGLTAVSGLFFFVMAGDGELRVFILLGALGGGVLFFCLLSQPMRPLWEFWTSIFLKPVLWAKKFLVKCWKNFKKLFSFCRKWFTIMFTQHQRPPKNPAEKEKMRWPAIPRKKRRKQPKNGPAAS